MNAHIDIEHVTYTCIRKGKIYLIVPAQLMELSTCMSIYVIHDMLVCGIYNINGDRFLVCILLLLFVVFVFLHSSFIRYSHVHICTNRLFCQHFGFTCAGTMLNGNMHTIGESLGLRA